MDPSQIDALVQRLVANPHDQEALGYAHQAGAEDPRSYALLLERVGNETQDASYASHWLSEAANVWSTTLGDAHRAARVLMQAIDRDPTQRVAAERLAQLYRDKGDVKALVALLERRAKALAPLTTSSPELRAELAQMHEELGRLWGENLAQPKKALENYRRSMELEPGSAYAIYGAREIYKSQGQLDEAYQLYDAELQVEGDQARKVAILRDEATTRRQAGDLQGASRALGRARQIDERDPTLAQEFASSVIERLQAGEAVPQQERTVATELLIHLAETYDGEHGLAYSGAALDVDPGHERGLQLFVYYARGLQREDGVTARYLAYVQANPEGEMSGEARQVLATSYEAAGQIDNAISMLEPLRARGDQSAALKLQELYPRAGQSPPAAASSGAALPSGGEGANPAVPAPPGRIGGAAPAMRAPDEGSVSKSISTSAARRLDPDLLQGVLDAAQMLANKGKKADALAKYKEVLEADPAHPEALAWVEDHLRTKRDYTQLRDILLAAVRTMPTTAETTEARKERLREVAGLCEGNLRDTDGAVQAWRQLLAIDRSDDAARAALTRLLERAQRWDELCNLLEQEATAEGDLEKKIALEKKLAQMQEIKRRDFGAAAEAWGRIARLTPEDDRAIATASKMFEKATRIEDAAQVIAENAPSVQDPGARGQLLERLGELREQLADAAGAGDAYSEAAQALQNAKLWEAAERCFVTAEAWERAAGAADQRAQVTADTKQQAAHKARAADHLSRGGKEDEAVAHLEQATELDPVSEDYAQQLADRYTTAGHFDRLVQLLVKRGDRLLDKNKRVAVRRQAAALYAQKLEDKEAARETWLKVLEDGDDREALERLVDDAVDRKDHTEATTLLRRLVNSAQDSAEKTRFALREAELLAEGVGDIDTAVARYEAVVAEFDPTCRPALQAIADLEEARENPARAADALERELKLVADLQERGQLGARLAQLYDRLDDPRSAIRSLDIVRKADPDDFDALTRLCDLCEKVEQWDRVAELLAARIEVEGDEDDASRMTRKLADILATKLDRGDEALAALTELADQGDLAVREAYVELGDRLGWKGIVATKLVEWWFEARPGAERAAALRGAFDRFADVGRDQDAVRVAVEIVRSRGDGKSLADKLESLAVKIGDLDALSTAHDLLARELTGAERAAELVRQAEAQVQAGAPRLEALQHGEAGLTSVPAGEAEPLLARLAEIAEKPTDVIDLYERQVTRCKTPADRARALARAAQVAASRNQVERGRGFFELALAGAPSDETLETLEQAAREGDEKAGGDKLRRALCSAFSAGGQGARDGGRTRGALLRRAASVAHRDLRDLDAAFGWLGDALIAHVDAVTLDALEALATEVADVPRAEATLTRALAEVFDGPLVRQLLARRAQIRRERLDDRAGAAADLKKLHDLSPTDHAVMRDLSALLTDLGDYRGLVQLYEDQILRGKDMNARAELARKVARMWEEQLQDPREAADAWRRVLRMKAGDPEAQAGLERAKSNMLKKPDPEAGAAAYAPPKFPSTPPASASTRPPPSTPPTDSARPQAAPLPSAPPPPLPPEEAAKPERPADLFFPRGSSEEITVSGPSDFASAAARPASEPPAVVRSSERAPESTDVTERGALLAPEKPKSLPPLIAADDDLAKTGQGMTLDFDAAPSSRIPVPIALDKTAVMPAADDEILVADDLAEMIDVDEDGDGEEPDASAKRSPPPPVGRG